MSVGETKEILKIPKPTIDCHIQRLGLAKKLDIWIPHELKEIHSKKRINACNLHPKRGIHFLSATKKDKKSSKDYTSSYSVDDFTLKKNSFNIFLNQKRANFGTEITIFRLLSTIFKIVFFSYFSVARLVITSIIFINILGIFGFRPFFRKLSCPPFYFSQRRWLDI